ncbi:uncharacterized protein BJ171DRAFT_599996 [Polychytrium aggregatum]|uniref:uncharacterized protein n=1 Tax=Polychytrium aggregatum TaxID=110093 RepID=UPI0022FE2204|nr:uncharacterized protein BJ171DRAFT_599996 [Polychytrium aggregatum]KAI9203429.1 hypothetical protein BJ171DRAFT_599996 [Polychytrium aggregatum]
MSQTAAQCRVDLHGFLKDEEHMRSQLKNLENKMITETNIRRSALRSGGSHAQKSDTKDAYDAQYKFEMYGYEIIKVIGNYCKRIDDLKPLLCSLQRESGHSTLERSARPPEEPPRTFRQHNPHRHERAKIPSFTYQSPPDSEEENIHQHSDATNAQKAERFKNLLEESLDYITALEHIVFPSGEPVPKDTQGKLDMLRNRKDKEKARRTELEARVSQLSNQIVQLKTGTISKSKFGAVLPPAEFEPQLKAMREKEMRLQKELTASLERLELLQSEKTILVEQQCKSAMLLQSMEKDSVGLKGEIRALEKEKAKMADSLTLAKQNEQNIKRLYTTLTHQIAILEGRMKGDGVSDEFINSAGIIAEWKTKCEGLKEKVAVLEIENKRLEVSASESEAIKAYKLLEEKTKEFDEKLTIIDSAMVSSHGELALARKEKTEAIAELNKAKTERDEMAAAVEKHLEEIGAIRAQCLLIEKTLTQKEAELTAASEELQRSNKSKSDSELEIERITLELETKTKNIADIEEQLAIVRAEKAAVETSLAQVQSQLETAEQERTLANDLVAAHACNLELANKSVEIMTIKLADAKVAHEAMHSELQSIRELRDQMTQVEEDHRSYIKRLGDQISSLTTENVSLAKALEEERQSISTLTDELQAALKDIRESQSICSQIQSDLDLQTELRESCAQRIEALSSENGQVKAELADTIHKHQQALSALEDDKMALEAELAKLTHDIERIAEEHQMLQIRSAQDDSYCSGLKALLRDRECEVERLVTVEIEFHQLKIAHDELAQLHQCCVRPEVVEEQLRQQMLQANAASIAALKQEHQADLDALQDAHQKHNDGISIEHQNEISALQNQHSSELQQITQMQRQAQEALETLEQVTLKLKAEIEEEKQVKSQLQQHIAQLESNIAEKAQVEEDMRSDLELKELLVQELQDFNNKNASEWREKELLLEEKVKVITELSIVSQEQIVSYEARLLLADANAERAAEADDLKHRLEIMASDLAAMEERTQELQRMNQEMVSIKLDLEVRIDELQAANRKLELEIESAAAEREEHARELSGHLNRLEETRQQASQASDDLSRLQGKQSSLMTDLLAREQRIAELQDRIDQLTKELQVAHESIHSLQDAPEAVDTQTQTDSEAIDRSLELQLQVERESCRVAELIHELETSQSRSKLEIEALGQELSESQRLCIEHQKQIELAQSNAEAREQTMQSLSEEKDHLSIQIADLKLEVRRCEEKAQTSIGASQLRISALEAQLEQAALQLQVTAKTTELLNQLMASSASRLDRMSSEYDSLKTTHSSCGQEIDELRGKLVDLEAFKADSQMQQAQYQDEIARLTERLQKISSQDSEAQALKLELQNEVSALRQQVEQWRDTATGLERELGISKQRKAGTWW